jgi:hypothetical protein
MQCPRTPFILIFYRNFINNAYSVYDYCLMFYLNNFFKTNSKFFCPIANRHPVTDGVGSMLFFQLFIGEKFGASCFATGSTDSGNAH